MGGVLADEEFEAVFGDLFVRCGQVAHRLLGDRFAAEEVAAEAMARAYAQWGRIRHLPHRDAWVLRVATNLAIDRVRRRIPAHVVDEPIRIEDVVALRVTLAAALGQLPRRQREVVGLRYLSGLSEPEVAAVTGLSVGTVKTHLRRGLARLRAALQDREVIQFAG